MATTQSPPFGDLLRRYRRAAGLTQEELAELALLSRRSISDMERGVPHRPRKDTIELLGDALRLSLEERGTFEMAARQLGALPEDELSSEQARVLDGKAGELQRVKLDPVSRRESIKRPMTWRRPIRSPPIVAGSVRVVVLALAVAVVLYLFSWSNRHAHTGSIQFTLRQPIAILGTSTVPGAIRLQSPSSIAVDPQGNLYITDLGNRFIHVISPGGSVLTEWGTQGTAPGQFNNPLGVALDLQGNVYVTDLGNETVQKFSAGGTLLAWHGRVLLQNGLPSGVLQSYLFGAPVGIAVDARGRVFVMDEYDSCVAMFSSTLKLRGCWGTQGKETNEFLNPLGLSIDAEGDLYVADGGNNRIEKLSRPVFAPQPWTYSGQWVPGTLPFFGFLQTWGTNGPGLGQFLSPGGVAVDRQGNFYVVDSEECRVQEFSPMGQLLAAWGRQGTGPGEFRNPLGVAVDAQGNVYVADTGNNRIQKFAAG